MKSRNELERNQRDREIIRETTGEEPSFFEQVANRTKEVEETMYHVVKGVYHRPVLRYVTLAIMSVVSFTVWIAMNLADTTIYLDEEKSIPLPSGLHLKERFTVIDEHGNVEYHYRDFN